MPNSTSPGGLRSEFRLSTNSYCGTQYRKWYNKHTICKQMLRIYFIVLSLFALPRLKIKSWTYITTTLLFTTTLCLNTMQYPSIVSISPLSLLDPISRALILLSMWVTTLIFMARAKITLININQTLFSFISLSLLLTLLLSFRASNLFRFYIWFEASLIPTMILILIWGYQPERLQASMYLIIYTLTARLPLLLILCVIYTSSNHLAIFYPWINFPNFIDSFLGTIILLRAFMIKLPLFSVHLWLPKAHVEAPVAGSIILAAVLLKLGGYGLMRISLLFSKQLIILSSLLTSLAIIGAVLSSLICLRQPDLKSLIAYSSIGHIGILVAGVASLTRWGLIGALLIIIAHGIVSSGIFCLANITYEISHTRSIILTKGLLIITPSLTLLWFLLIGANIAAPPSINLLREIILISGTLAKNSLIAVTLATLRFTTVAYSLYLYSAISHGGHLILINPSPSLSARYYSLIIMHFAPIIGLITIPTYITNYLI